MGIFGDPTIRVLEKDEAISIIRNHEHTVPVAPAEAELMDAMLISQLEGNLITCGMAEDGQLIIGFTDVQRHYWLTYFRENREN